jgi:hypothetical protein
MPKMTKAQTAKHEKLSAKLNATTSAIYAFAPNRDTRFSDCWNMASPEAKEAHDEARRALTAFEIDMIAEGRAWRASYGMFTPNWR